MAVYFRGKDYNVLSQVGLTYDAPSRLPVILGLESYDNSNVAAARFSRSTAWPALLTRSLSYTGLAQCLEVPLVLHCRRRYCVRHLVTLLCVEAALLGGSHDFGTIHNRLIATRTRAYNALYAARAAPFPRRLLAQAGIGSPPGTL